MLQLQVIRQNPEWVKERLAVKYFNDASVVDAIIELDDQRKKLQLEFDNTQAKINSSSKEIGQLMAKGDKEKAEELKQNVASFKSSLQPISNKLSETEIQLQNELVKLPNLPSEKVPKGKTPEENVTLREGGNKPALPKDALPHWELAKKYDLINFELGNKITGSGFPVYKNKGAKLQRALIQYFLDYNTKAGYTEYLPPHMVNEATAFGTGQLPDKEGQMYFVTEDKFYLIPTAEVPVTNIYRDEILKETDLPIKMTAYTPCFRREAGSYGKDVRGLNRLHQFDKVEIVQLVHPDKSYDAHEEMVSHVERLVQSLELPYRVLLMCGGDLGFAQAKKYDLEVWAAGQKRWLEVSSCSNFEAFQARRAQIRYRAKDTGKAELVHTLNGSGLAVPRVLAALLENNLGADGRVKIPAALRPH